MIDDLDHDSIWCTNNNSTDSNVTVLLNRKHQDTKSAENSLSVLRQVLMTEPCPAEVLSISIIKFIFLLTKIE